MRNIYEYVSICFILSFFVSCENKEKRLHENQYADAITVKITEVVVPTKDELFLRDYNMISSFVNNSSLDVIAGYNYRIHALDLFSPQRDYLKQINLEKEGANGILLPIDGLFFHSFDSIWIYSQGIIYLTDTIGIVKEKIDIGKFQKEEIIYLFSNYSVARINLYYNKKRKSFSSFPPLF